MQVDRGSGIRREEKSTFITEPQRRWFTKDDPHTNAVLIGYTDQHGEVRTKIMSAPAALTFNYIADRLRTNLRLDALQRQRQFECFCAEAFWMLHSVGEFNPDRVYWPSIRALGDNVPRPTA